jgi:hypothetical protein
VLVKEIREHDRRQIVPTYRFRRRRFKKYPRRWSTEYCATACLVVVMLVAGCWGGKRE